MRGSGNVDVNLEEEKVVLIKESLSIIEKHKQKISAGKSHNNAGNLLDNQENHS